MPKALMSTDMFNGWLKPYASKLTEGGVEVIISKAKPPLKAADWLADLDGVEILFANGNDQVPAEVINAASDLKVICRTGVGYDRVDTSAAAKKRVPVTVTAGANSEAVADYAFGLMLAIARRITEMHDSLKAGKWAPKLGVDVYRKTLGIMGLGRIGQAVARRAAGFNMRLLGCDPIVQQAAVASLGVTKVELDQLLAESDFVSLHMPASAETKGIIGGRTLQLMKPTAFLINTSRGALVDEKALERALREKWIAGAALDVFAGEPLTVSPLFELDNVVLSPHIAGASIESTAQMAQMAIDNALAVLSGTWPDYVVVNGVHCER